MKDTVRKFLYGFPAHDLGNKFVVMTRLGLVKIFMEEVRHFYTH